MAHLVITLPVIPVEQRKALVKNLTDTVGNILDFPVEARERISIALTMHAANELARGGELLNGKGANFFHVDMYAPTLGFDQKKALAEHLTNALAESLKLPIENRDRIFVTFHQFAPENVAAGGHLMIEMALA